MDTKKQIQGYIASQSEAKQTDMNALHTFILSIMPGCKLWYLDGKDSTGKVVSNPNIGYGQYTINYAGGKSREFYQIGLSANTTGISVYIMGIADKKYLSDAYSTTIGKASVSGYCIKFKALKDINLTVLESAILSGVEQSSVKQ